MNVAAVILASGCSRRFGSDKMKAPWGPSSLLPFFLSHWPRHLFCRTVVVVKKEDQSLLPQGFEGVVNDQPELGQGHSIRLAAEGLGDEEGALFVMADMPLLSEHTVSHLLSQASQRPHQPHAACCEGQLKNPVYFPRRTFKALMALQPHQTGKAALQGSQLIPVPVPSHECWDVDYPADLKLCRQKALQLRSEALARALLPEKSCALAFVGGGGKTSTLWLLAHYLARRGEKVVVTTTTHMGSGPLPSVACPRPEKGKVIYWAQPKGDGFCAPANLEDCAPELLNSGVWLLIEADGSRQLPVKAPAAHEPALPSWVGRVLWVCNPYRAQSGTISEVAHRPELVCALTGLGAEDRLDDQALALLAQSWQGGLKNLPSGADWRWLLTGPRDVSVRVQRLLGSRALVFDAWPEEKEGKPLEQDDESLY